jgi:hypothetical protein
MAPLQAGGLVLYGLAMSSALAAAGLPPSEHISFESRLFQASPLGTATTAALVFGLGWGGFLLIAALTHYALVGPKGVAFDRATAGLVSPLLLAAALGMRRYADLKQRADDKAFAAILGSEAVPVGTLLRPVSTTGTIAWSLAGAAVGAVVAFVSLPAIMRLHFPLAYAWQAALIVLLCVLFARGIVAASRSWRRLRRIIDQGLRIDLLHADKLSVIGRQSARNALVWFVNAAIVCLYFVGGDSGLTTVPILVVCAGIGLWIFLHPMSGVHRRIHAAKSAELDRVRDEIADASRREADDATAAARLPGLIAYEARIQAVREWPFDQSTLIRVASYLLIPAIPWFGEALVSDLIQRVAR